MTETSAVTISNFISAVLVGGVAIVVISNIVIDQITSSNSGIDNSAIQELETKITRVCEGTQDTANGEISMSSGTRIILEGDTMNIEGVDPENINGQETERDLSCPIEARKVMENTELYTITSSGGSYDIR